MGGVVWVLGCVCHLVLLLLLLLLHTSNIWVFLLDTENVVGGGVGPWLCMPSCFYLQAKYAR